jgi:hypothetical protein
MAIGVCVKEKSEVDINKVFREAEDRMYQNKLTESRGVLEVPFYQLYGLLYGKKPR